MLFKISNSMFVLIVFANPKRIETIEEDFAIRKTEDSCYEVDSGEQSGHLIRG